MFQRFRGDSDAMTWTLKVNGVKVNLTTATLLEFTFKKENGSQTTITGTVVDALNGQVQFPVAESDFNEVETVDFDIQITFSDATKETYIVDEMMILDDVNKT